MTPSPGSQPPRARPELWDLFLISAAVAFGPAMALVNNAESPGPLTAALVVVVIVALALIVRWALIRLGADPRGATYGLAVFSLTFMNTGSLIGSFPGGRWGVIAIGVIAGVIVYRLRNMRVNDILITWGAFALVAAPLVTWVGGWDSSSTEIGTSNPVEASSFSSTPDVVLLVTDGYASNAVLAEFYDYDNSSFTSELTDSSFEVNGDMTANYGRTSLSVPSLLQMNYVLDGEGIGRAEQRALLAALGGDNNIARTMIANGYRTVYVESGWLGTQCSELIDVCVPGPWPDETLYDLAHRSALRDLPGFETGRSFGRGALHSLRWLEDELDGYLMNGQPEFIYVHLLAPHPPLFIDASCALAPRTEVAGFAVGTPWYTEPQLQARKDAYVRQVECVNTYLLSAARRIGQARAVALMTADHGPDGLAQLFFNGDQWTTEQKRERFGIFFAAHHPGCSYADLRSLINVGRRMISCLSNTEIEILPDRYFDLHKSTEGSKVVEIGPPGR